MGRVERSPDLDRGFFRTDPGAVSKLYLRPAGLLYGEAAEAAVAGGRGGWLAGRRIAFSALELLAREGGRIRSAVAAFSETVVWSRGEGGETERAVGRLLARIARPRPAYAGLSLDRPRVMGVINVTPDSFSDGGLYADAGAAVAHGKRLLEDGADLLDVGGESTRPGAEPVPEEEERRRVIPVIRDLRGTEAVLSVDTRRAAVMREALAAGATVLNDVTALAGDPASLEVAARTRPAPSVVLMHMQGEPRTMQERPTYGFAPLDVYDFLEERVTACAARGIDSSRIAVDPGIGFGKTVAHNLEILARLTLFHGLGCALAIGASRKSFIGAIAGCERPGTRLPGSLASALAALDQGAHVLRVHDVAETVQAAALWGAVRGA